MSFQFPANPQDGDVLVQTQTDGSLIKGTYDSATNTWAIGEIPKEPGIPGPMGPAGAKGEKGDPGKGVAVSGVVGTLTSLPSAGSRPLQFWIVDDTNTLYYSDGNSWFDLGSPITGPAGQNGADGANGADGQNGSAGKGWTSATIIDDRPTGYFVRFNSDDGLGFTTDNILGPQGETGALQVASDTNLGGIKIGRGLTIKPDGTLQAGETAVDLETVPLTPEGTVYSYTLGYTPQVYGLGTEKEESWLGARHDDAWSTDSVDIKMPDTANRALVYMFSSTQFWGASNFPGTVNSIYAFRGYIVSELFLEEAEYEYGRSNAMAFQTTHNLTIGFNSDSIANRYSVLPVTKVNEISFLDGATVKFNWQQTLYRTGNCRIKGGLCRLIVIPFREESINAKATPVPFQKVGDTYYFSKALGQKLLDQEFPPMTSDEENAEASTALKSQINKAMDLIDLNLPYVNSTTSTTLISIRDQLYAARDQPGTYTEVTDYVSPLIAQVNTLLDYKFRFE